jgi:DMSO/TMAO reductase YedYZ molybdopterin-dependent catalytic subunit
MTALRFASALCVLTLHAAAVPATLAAQPAAAQAPAGAAATPGTGTLAITGDIARPLTLTPAELRTLPRSTVKVTDEDGRTLTYEGVMVDELLRRVGAPIGKELRGNALATYVIASAKDGYQVVFSIGELDPAMTTNEIMVADTVEGKPLFDYQGPLRLVSPKDKRGARSVRMLERMEIVRLKK